MIDEERHLEPVYSAVTSRADIALIDFFGSQFSGRYLEIETARNGAQTLLSLLSRRGWRGVVIDNSLHTQSFCLDRPLDEVLSGPIKETAGSERFRVAIGSEPVDLVFFGEPVQPASLTKLLRSVPSTPRVLVGNVPKRRAKKTETALNKLGYELALTRSDVSVYCDTKDSPRIQSSFAAMGLPTHVSEATADAAIRGTEQLTVARDNLETALRSAMHGASTSRAELQEAARRIANLDQSVADLSGETQHLRESLAATQSRYEDLSASHKKAIVDLEVATVHARGMIEALEVSEAGRAELLAERSSLHDQLDRMSEAIAALQAQSWDQMRDSLVVAAPSQLDTAAEAPDKDQGPESATPHAEHLSTDLDQALAEIESEAFRLLDAKPARSQPPARRANPEVVLDLGTASEDVGLSRGQLLQAVNSLADNPVVVLLAQRQDRDVSSSAVARSGRSAYSASPQRTALYVAVNPDQNSISRSLPFLLHSETLSVAVVPTSQDGSGRHLEHFDHVVAPATVAQLVDELDRILTPTKRTDHRELQPYSRRRLHLIGPSDSALVAMLDRARRADPSLQDHVAITTSAPTPDGLLDPDQVLTFVVGHADDANRLAFLSELGGAAVLDGTLGSWQLNSPTSSSPSALAVLAQMSDEVFVHGDHQAEEIEPALGFRPATQHVFAPEPPTFSSFHLPRYWWARLDLQTKAEINVVIAGQLGTRTCPLDLLIEFVRETTALTASMAFHLVSPPRPNALALLEKFASENEHQIVTVPPVGVERHLLHSGSDLVVGLTDDVTGSMAWELAEWISHGVPCLGPLEAVNSLGEVAYCEPLVGSVGAWAKQVVALAKLRRVRPDWIEAERLTWLSTHSPSAYISRLISDL